MNKKRYLRALGIFLSYCLLTMQLPYTQKSALTYIVPLIRIYDSTFSLHLLINSFLLTWMYIELVDSKLFNARKVVTFIVFFIILVPISMVSTNLLKTPIYYLHNDVGSIEIKKSSIHLSKIDNVDYINVNLTLKGHRTLDEGFKINIELDHKLMAYIESMESDETVYYIEGGEVKYLEINLPVKFKRYNGDRLFRIKSYNTDYGITFIGENRVQKNVRNDMYDLIK